MNNKKWLIATVLIIVVVVIGLVIFLPGGESSNKDIEKQETNSPTTTNITPAETAGQYIEYSDDLLTNSTLGTKILFFHASWCPQCRELEDSIEMGDIPSGVTIIKVDYDDNQSLRSRYGVTIQTTLIKIDNEGNLLEKYVAYDSPSLTAVVENLL